MVCNTSVIDVYIKGIRYFLLDFSKFHFVNLLVASKDVLFLLTKCLLKLFGEFPIANRDLALKIIKGRKYSLDSYINLHNIFMQHINNELVGIYMLRKISCDNFVTEPYKIKPNAVACSTTENHLHF